MGITNKTWWIPKQKKYRIETKEWWCSNCEEVTPLERNPEWDGTFRGERPAPEWFVRCGNCWSKHYQSTGFDCPTCGYEPGYYELEPLRIENMQYSMWASMEWGGSPYNWDEWHMCPFCEEKFMFQNSNY